MKDSNRHFTKEKINTANKHGTLLNLIIGEM